jgi:predicted transcriptional regulator
MSKSPKVTPFAQVPLEVLYNAELSHSARVLYALILSKVAKEGHCFATNETLAEWLGTSESTVVKRLKELKSKELIKTFYTTTEAGSTRKIYPQIVIKRVVENQQKGVSNSISNNSLSKERQRRVLWQRPSPSSGSDPVGSSPNENKENN